MESIGFNDEPAALLPRAPSVAFVSLTDAHTVTLNPGGTLSDIVLLQGHAGNPVTVADLLAANPQYTDVTKIPAGAELNVPVRTGDVLSIYRGSGAVDTINTRTAEITSTTQDAQGNTHQVISRPDGDDGRIYIERTLDSGTGEVVSASAVRVDTLTGQTTAIDPVSLEPVDAAEVQGPVQDGFNQAPPDTGTPPNSGTPPNFLADAGTGTMTDAGPINGYGDILGEAGASQAATEELEPPRDAAGGSISLDELGAQLSAAQTQQLYRALATLGLDDAEIAGVTVYTNPDGSRILANEEGEIIGTAVSHGQGHDAGEGAPGWLEVRLNGQEEAVFLGPQGQAMGAGAYHAQVSAQNAAGAMNLIGSLVGLENWSSLNDAQRLSTLASLYNQADNLGTALNHSDWLPGNIGAQAGALSGVLGLVSGIENDNALQALAGGIQLGNAVGTLMGSTGQVASEAIGGAVGVNAGQVVPILNLIIALDNIEENPLGAVAAAVGFIPVYGQVLAAFITVYSMLADQDIPASVGEAEVHIDESGAVVVNTVHDEHGGGGTAAAWTRQLAEVALSVGMSAPQAGAPAQHLPTVGYYYDPDGPNVAHSAGHLILRWTDENGEDHERYYDSSGMRWDGESVEGESDIMRDYLELLQDQQKWPPVMYQEVLGGVMRVDYGVATVLYATALGTFDGMESHTHGGEEDTDGGEAFIGAGSSQVISLSNNTVENSTGQQTQATLGAGQIQSVPAMGASPYGPQPPMPPRGRDPIVFVPAQAMTGGNRTVTAGMVTSLNQAALFSDAQLAANALALGLSGMAFASHASTGWAEGGGRDVQPASIQPLPTNEMGWGALAVAPGTTAQAQGSGALPPGDWTDAQGQVVARGGTTWSGDAGAPDQPALAVQRQTLTPELMGDPAPVVPSAVAEDAEDSLLPPGYAATEVLDANEQHLAPSQDVPLEAPTVRDDGLRATEDQGLTFSAEQLLANDSTPNPVPQGHSGAYYNGLRVIEVADAQHGQGRHPGWPAGLHP
ncbi:MAG: hypothetical protein R3E94_18275 [Burkholderiaceae bacterium]